MVYRLYSQYLSLRSLCGEVGYYKGSCGRYLDVDGSMASVSEDN